MTLIIISIIATLAFFAVLGYGVRNAFGWVYLPVLMLVPARAVFDLPGLPDLTPGRAAALGLIAGTIANGRFRQLIPDRRLIDLVALLPVLTFAVSYGQVTDFKGFYSRLAILAMDWGCPYFFTRVLITDMVALRTVLKPFTIFACVTALFAIYESRMAFRLAPYLWNSIGVVLEPIPHYGSWRWGFLRAHATFYGPIQLGTFFAMATPLARLWGVLDPRRNKWSWLSTLLSAGGCIASMSRGPIVVLIVVTIIAWTVAKPRQSTFLVALALLISSSPFLYEMATEEVKYTSARVEATGNTAGESGHYRVALLLIYGKEIANVGCWGDPYLVGREYEAAWSIDNAYLYLFLIGGWFGGGSVCLLILITYFRTLRRLMNATDHDRKVLAILLAAFAGMTGSMANVWFAIDYAPFFWWCQAILINIVTLYSVRNHTIADSLNRVQTAPQRFGCDCGGPAANAAYARPHLDRYLPTKDP